MVRFTVVPAIVVVLLMISSPGPAQDAPKLSEDALVIQTALDDSDYLRVSGMVTWLNREPVRAEPFLIELLDGSKLQGVREWAAELLRRPGPTAPAAIPALVRCLARPEDRAARIAARALCEYGQTAAPELLAAVRCTDPRLQLHAGELLIEMKLERVALSETLLENLRSENEETRLVAAWLLGRLAGPGHPPPIARGRFGFPERRIPVRPARPAGVTEVLVAISASLADDPDPAVRVAAAELIAAAGPRGMEEAEKLKLLLEDADERVRLAAALAFADLGHVDDSVLNTLCLVISRQKSLPVRIAAVRALASMGPAGRVRLGRIAKKRESEIRRAAKAAIAEYDQREAEPGD